ncbi:MAG TPA: hypothetical protein VF593_00125 [Chthoniobacteraceae bacterium]|jgi:hypothetical protein
MKIAALLIATAVSLAPGSLRAEENPPGVPADYKLVYASDFKPGAPISEFVFSDPAVWKVSGEGGKPALELTAQSKYKPPFRSPVNLALLAGKSFGDVIFEAKCLQTGKEYGHRDMVFYYGFQDPAHFYYTHLATAADDHAHNCFLVNGAARVKFAAPAGKGVDWGLGVWHHVRIERKADTGLVRVFFDDMTKPIMEATDKTFATGAIGFGSFDDTGKIADVKVWAPKVEAKEIPPFAKAP